MTFALAGLVATVLVFHAYCSRGWERERARFVHALLARGPADFAALERLAEPPRKAWLPKRRERTEDGDDPDNIAPIGLGG